MKLRNELIGVPFWMLKIDQLDAVIPTEQMIIEFSAKIVCAKYGLEILYNSLYFYSINGSSIYAIQGNTKNLDKDMGIAFISDPFLQYS